MIGNIDKLNSKSNKKDLEYNWEKKKILILLNYLF